MNNTPEGKGGRTQQEERDNIAEIVTFTTGKHKTLRFLKLTRKDV